jgi:MerR family transcriptional regulator, light-induced transcriptional regulator
MQEWCGTAEISSARGPFDDGGEGREGRASAELRRANLAQILKVEVLPRLVAVRPMAAPGRSPNRPKPADPEALAKMLVAGRLSEARAEIVARIDSGATHRAVMLEDLAAAARRLGELWESDACDFFDVTVGLGALRNLAKDINAEDVLPTAAGAPAILILLTPGETHELGADMVESFFRVAGWRAVRGQNRTFLRLLERVWFDVAGFSLSCERCIEALRAAIRHARVASRNPKITILVGGPIFAVRPGLAESLGADICASDAKATVHLPYSLLEALRL